jgi:hypothetical protein
MVHSWDGASWGKFKKLSIKFNGKKFKPIHARLSTIPWPSAEGKDLDWKFMGNVLVYG